MKYQENFRRYELKYLLSPEQKTAVLKGMKGCMALDDYGRSTICNIYYDTPDKLLIRRSLEKPVYKEKLRVRSYGTATLDSTVYVELKKKYKSVVYKRRVSATTKEALDYMERGIPLRKRCQIAEELDYTCSLYGTLEPAVYLSYEREAYYGLEDSGLRITFDENIFWRDTDISLCKPAYGRRIIDRDRTLMEIKISDAMPLWLAKLLSENGIFQTSFSKYGTAYEQMLADEQTRSRSVS